MKILLPLSYQDSQLVTSAGAGIISRWEKVAAEILINTCCPKSAKHPCKPLASVSEWFVKL
jgi:hypothetical protein